jgi:prepilin-type processing-associated H-X9-DG protein
MRKLSRCAKPSHALLLIDGKSSLSFGFYGVDYVFQFSDFRHAGQCNELFADGHVENSKLSDAQQMYLDGTFKNDDSSEFWPE